MKKLLIFVVVVIAITSTAYAQKFDGSACVPFKKMTDGDKYAYAGMKNIILIGIFVDSESKMENRLLNELKFSLFSDEEKSGTPSMRVNKPQEGFHDARANVKIQKKDTSESRTISATVEKQYGSIGQIKNALKIKLESQIDSDEVYAECINYYIDGSSA